MTPDTIIVHCSATPETQNVTVEQIDEMHRLRGFRRPVQAEKLKCIGYHYYIRRDGTVCPGRLETEVGAHCAGRNSRSVGICYEGGLDRKGQVKDTRTTAQKTALRTLIGILCRKYDIREILGHRDTSPDANKDGIIEPDEWVKGCPSFDAKTEYQSYLKHV
jgi:N-acetyl-anhydromuramyl-L-alanine amidase AmpD